MSGRVYDHAWRKVRTTVLARDGHLCRIKGRGCTEKATEVDHIVPVEAGGRRLDPANLRACCGHCNRARAAREKHREGWRRSPTRIVVVIGPPGAGKSSHVEAHRDPADLVVDYDAVAQAFGSNVSHGHARSLHSVTMRARGAVITALRRGEVPDVPRAWIVTANPAGETMFPAHEVVTVDPGLEETLRRGAAAGRPPAWVDLVHAWYRDRAPAEGPSRVW